MQVNKIDYRVILELITQNVLKHVEEMQYSDVKNIEKRLEHQGDNIAEIIMHNAENMILHSGQFLEMLDIINGAANSKSAPKEAGVVSNENNSSPYSAEQKQELSSLRKMAVEISKNQSPSEIAKLGEFTIVYIIESEAGWGTRVEEILGFTDKKIAEQFVKFYNIPNNKQKTPSWYMYAQIMSS